MTSPGKPSPRSAVRPLSDEQVARLDARHHLVDPSRERPTGPREDNEAEIEEQNPRQTRWLLAGASFVVRLHSKVRAWGLERIPERGVFITAATHVTMFDVFVPMMALFHMGRRPRYMAKAELGHWPVIGRWFRLVGMQPVPRRSGQAKAIEDESIRILTSGRPLTVWPEGTVTRDPKKWPMSLKNGVGIIALQASRKLGHQVPLFCAVTWGPPASTIGGPGRAKTSSCAMTSGLITPICSRIWNRGARNRPEPPPTSSPGASASACRP